MQTIVQEIPGARESSAGDDFHLLWAGRKALQLLMPNSRLQALKIEGLAPVDAGTIDPHGDKLLSVDMTEYYGGERFELADSIIISQLKYSTRKPQETWTAARLCTGKDGSDKSSIIRRFAETFACHYKKYGREEVSKKVKIKLVSNRPVSTKLRKIIQSLQAFLHKHPDQVTKCSLKNSLKSRDDREEIERIILAAHLKSIEFSDFIRVLDFTDCGEQSRFGQIIELVRELGRFGPGEVQWQQNALMELIRKNVMPETSYSHPLLKEDILPIFGIAKYEYLFPAPPRFELSEQDKLVNRSEASTLAKTVVHASRKPICLHSGAGLGKTTLLHMLESKLPTGSVVIIFDCFGGGLYRNPDEIRHIHRRAIPEIANELATRTGGHLLLHVNESSEDLLRELQNRIKIAVTLLQKLNQEALVVVAIDAADNSVHAASEKSQKSFVQDLLQLSIPEGARLIISSRTENVGLFELPKHEQLELKGFNLSESAEHLRFYFPEANMQQTEEFHNLTKGIPRTQGYALSYRSMGLDAVLSPLRPRGKSLEDLFEEQLRSAGERTGIPRLVRNICSALISLPRPVPIKYIARLTEASTALVKDFCVDVGFGLVLEEDKTISFRDQDFEDYLRSHISHTGQCDKQIADILHASRFDDRYAAYHLGDFLARTGRFDVLFHTITEEDLSSSIDDVVERQMIILKRIRAALKISESYGKNADVIKLLFIAAETVKKDSTVRRLIMENPDLAEEFGDPHTVQRLHLETINHECSIAELFKCASIFSRHNSMRDKAKQQMKEAHARIRWILTLPNEKMHELHLNASDITAGAEAILRLEGLESAMEWLSKWQPKHIIGQCAYQLTISLLQNDDCASLLDDLSKAKLRADLILKVIRAFCDSNMQPPDHLVERAARVWYRFFRCGNKVSPDIHFDGIILSEAAAKNPSLHVFLSDILNLFYPPLLTHAYAIYFDKERPIDGLLRSRIMLSLISREPITFELFLPERLKQDPKGLPESKRSEFDREYRAYKDLFTYLIPAYELRARVILSLINRDEIQARFNECIASIAKSSANYNLEGRNDFIVIIKLFALALTDVAIMHVDEASNWINQIEKAILKRERKDSSFLRFALAQKASRQKELQYDVLRLLNEISENLKNAPGTAQDHIESLIRCTRIASVIDSNAAKEYFLSAIEAASNVDEDAISHITCLSEYAIRAEGACGVNGSKYAYEFARFAEDCHFRLEGWDDFPWQQIVSGISHLDTASGFTILSRWEDRNILDTREHIVTLLSTAVKKRYISPETAYAFYILDGSFNSNYTDFIEILLKELVAQRKKERANLVLDMACSDVQLNVPLDLRKARVSQLLELSKSHGFDSISPIRALGEQLNFLLKLDEDKEKPSRYAYTFEEKLASESDWNSILKNRTFDTAKDIENAIEGIRNAYDKFGFDRYNGLLMRIADRCPPHKYLTYLNALFQTKSSILPNSILLESLKYCFKRWSSHPGIKKWKLDNASSVLERVLSDFIDSNYRDLGIIQEAVDLLEIKSVNLFGPIIKLVQEREDISIDTLYSIIKLLSTTLPSSETADILAWDLERNTKQIPITRGDGLWNEELCPPDNMTATISAFIWKYLGHPDKSIRWRISHVTRRILAFGDATIFDNLIARIDDRSSHKFCDSNYKFFWLSARLWLLMLIDRLVLEFPNIIIKYSDLIAACTLQSNLPHVLIRHYAKSAALNLQEKYKVYDESKMREIEAVNTSPFEPIQEQAAREKNLRTKELPSLHFPFDHMDTMRYWYEPLGNVFGETAVDIAAKAEAWIYDKWCITNIEAHDDPLKGRYEWDLWNNYQGEDSKIEIIQSYAEWHSMFCVAGELLKEKPIVKNKWKEDVFL